MRRSTVFQVAVPLLIWAAAGIETVRLMTPADEAEPYCGGGVSGIRCSDDYGRPMPHLLSDYTLPPDVVLTDKDVTAALAVAVGPDGGGYLMVQNVHHPIQVDTPIEFPARGDASGVLTLHGGSYVCLAVCFSAVGPAAVENTMLEGG